jgi:hypothetical protein
MSWSAIPSLSFHRVKSASSVSPLPSSNSSNSGSPVPASFAVSSQEYSKYHTLFLGHDKENEG